MGIQVRVHGASHPGVVHTRNEDSFAIVPTSDGGTLLLVCDGMGGMGRGDEASRLAVEELIRAFGEAPGDSPTRLRAAIASADHAVRAALCAEGGGRAGSTVASAYVEGGKAHVAWVGDSRVYLVRGSEVVRRTKDHKLVQDLVDSGQLTAEEARRSALSSVITRALGGRPPDAPAVIPDGYETPWELARGDRLLLCSDGLSDLVTDQELGRLLHTKTPPAACEVLIGTAIARGGHDNITIVVASVHDTDAITEAPPPPRSYAPRRRPTLDPMWVAVTVVLVGWLSWLLVRLARGA